MEPNYQLVTPRIADYVKENIFPRYDLANGHGVDHIKNVIRRSLDFASRINSGEIKTSQADFAGLPAELATPAKVDYDMCFVVAAYHDLGRNKNDKLHHLISAAYLLDDDFIEANFTRDQLRVMADAVMDHRASNTMPPATIYGRIVSSADRDTDTHDILRRAWHYNRHKYPDHTEAEAMDYVFNKIVIKFAAPDAYGAKKMFFDNPEFDALIREFRRITADRALFESELKQSIAEG